MLLIQALLVSYLSHDRAFLELTPAASNKACSFVLDMATCTAALGNVLCMYLFNLRLPDVSSSWPIFFLWTWIRGPSRHDGVGEM